MSEREFHISILMKLKKDELVKLFNVLTQWEGLKFNIELKSENWDEALNEFYGGEER